MGKTAASCSTVDNLKEIRDRVNQLENEFSNKLLRFKEDMLSKGSSGGSGPPSDDILIKFQEFEKNIMESIFKIKEDVSKKLSDLEYIVDETIQKSNNKSLLLHGFLENEGKLGEADDVFQNLINFIQNKFQVHIEKADIFDCYRLGKKSKDKPRPRPLVVEFLHKWKRDEIFYRKSKLKGSPLMLTEVLTGGRLQIFKRCSQLYRGRCWTTNGKVIVLLNGKKVIIRNIEDLTKYSNI